MTFTARILIVLVLTGCAAADAGAEQNSLRQYVATWAPAYRAFEQSYVRAFRPCLTGAATKSCADGQQRAAAAATKTAAVLHGSAAPAALTKDMAQLERDLRAAARTLGASAAAARTGNTSPHVWCSAEQGPCTVVMIDMGNAINDINFTANVDLPLPG
jgi:hypothetical protein